MYYSNAPRIPPRPAWRLGGLEAWRVGGLDASRLSCYRVEMHAGLLDTNDWRLVGLLGSSWEALGGFKRHLGPQTEIARIFRRFLKKKKTECSIYKSFFWPCSAPGTLNIEPPGRFYVGRVTESSGG